METLKKGIKRLLIFSVTAVAVLGSILLIYLQRSDAPVLTGKVEFHIPYSDQHTLDIYYPTSENHQQPAPVLMYIHGGAWISGSKLTVNNNRFNDAFNTLRDQGYFIVSPDYTLAEDGESPFPNCIQDIFTATQWVAENADKYDWNMDDFGVLGESAGGHLAMMLTYSDPKDFDLDFPRQKVSYLIDIYGPCDLNELYHAATTDSINAIIDRLPASLADHLDLSKLLVGFDPEERPDQAEAIMRELSPVSYMDEADVPVLIIHGKKDQIVPVEQSYLLTTKLDSLNADYSAYYFDGVNHAFAGATPAQKDSIQTLIKNFVAAQKLIP